MSARRRKFAALAVACLLCAGCPQEDATAPVAPSLPFVGQSVRLLVVDDPPLANAAERLAGEWKARSGATVEVQQCDSAALMERPTLDADAVVYPGHLISVLGERGWLRTLTEAEQQHAALGWREVLAVQRSHETQWGGQVTAVPFGSPVLVLHYRADLLRAVGREPPRNWTQYAELAAALADRAALGAAAPPADRPWRAIAEPLAPGWAGLTLLARAAGYARHPYFHSTLFDLEDMTPLIDQPPLVRALTELAAAQRAGGGDPLDPRGVQAAFWGGECGLALTWTAAAAIEPDAGREPAERGEIDAGFSELPGAEAVYNRQSQKWEPAPRDQPHRVTLLGVSGRLGSVATAAAQPDAALELLIAMSGDEWGPQVCPASASTGMFRMAHLKSPRTWTGRQIDPLQAQQYSEAVAASVGRTDVLFALRIPGRAEYLAALDAAVTQAVAQAATPEAALGQAAQAWQEITNRLGRDAQRRAYERSLGRAGR